VFQISVESVEMHFVIGSGGPWVEAVDVRGSKRFHISKEVAELRRISETFGQQAGVTLIVAVTTGSRGREPLMIKEKIFLDVVI
jgi:hypothetical protein